MKIGINGFGRIGRLVFRALWDRADIEITHINEIAGDSNAAAHLLEFDSVHGRWVKDIKVKEEEIIIDGKKLAYTSFKNYLDVQLVGEHKSERHLLFSFVSSVSEHESLITSADVFVGAVLVDSLSDVRRLLLKTVLDSACEVVQPFFVRVVSDSLQKILESLKKEEKIQNF